MNKHHGEQALEKTIGFWTAITVVIGTIIGSGVFVKPSVVLNHAGTSDLAIWAWVVGGILTLAAGLTIAEVGAQIPKTGGLYAYIRDIYGPFWGFLTGWMQTVIYGPAIIASLSLFFGILVTNFFGIDPGLGIWIGIAAFTFLVILNILGTNAGGAMQTFTTICKLIPVFAIIVFGLLWGKEGVFGHNVTSLIENKGEINFGRAVLATLFAYDGWILLTNLTGEMKNAKRNLPLAMLVGLSVVTFAYVLINIAVFKVIPAETLVGLGNTSSAEAAKILFGDLGSKFVNIGVIISIFGCLNGKIMTFPRIPFAMADDNLLPFAKFISYVSPKFKTPIGAMITMYVVSMILLLLTIVIPEIVNADYLSEICIFVIYIFYIASFIGLFILRKQTKGQKRDYSVPLYPIVPIVAMGGGLFIIISTLMSDFFGSMLGVLFVVIGIPFYFMLCKKHV
ncbi:APC family permease [Macrococcoides caseolyticum]|uniref:APC family permease n=1 Tax=Macrococcoides caseolyticum TaxID=69966 RepID=UPI0011A449FF|nr:amino acid permease [Macrococcus caseolyticus]MDJ1089597.1 amino acid permease [Macrococcus caseolyticus]